VASGKFQFLVPNDDDTEFVPYIRATDSDNTATPSEVNSPPWQGKYIHFKGKPQIFPFSAFQFPSGPVGIGEGTYLSMKQFG
jgi:hypothetical protein